MALSAIGADGKHMGGYVSRDLKGTQPWTHFFVMLEVPKDADAIAFGPMLRGHGEMDFRGVKIDVRKAKRF
jgi:hypothetical protein